MMALAIVALVASAVTAYLIGAAFVAPRGSFLRSKRGVWLLVILGLSILVLPPQITSLDAVMGAGSSAITGLPTTAVETGVPTAPAVSGFAWPASIDKTIYLVIWVITSIAAFLVGLKIWKAGKPGWREGSSAFDSSAGSRVSGLLPMADTLAEALDTLGRAGLRPRDVESVGRELRETGRRFSQSLPERDGDVYTLVAARVPADVAGPVTGLLLEGAGRRGSST